MPQIFDLRRLILALATFAVVALGSAAAAQADTFTIGTDSFWKTQPAAVSHRLLPLTSSGGTLPVQNYDTFTLTLNGGGVITCNGGAGATGFVGIGTPTTPTPEPATMLLLGTGLLGVAGVARRFRKS